MSTELTQTQTDSSESLIQEAVSSLEKASQDLFRTEQKTKRAVGFIFPKREGPKGFLPPLVFRG